MSGLLVAPSAASPVRLLASPAHGALGADDLDVLSQLFSLPDPGGYAGANPECITALQPFDAPSQPCEPSPKRLRRSPGGSVNKSKSQSQRQKEEMVLLRQQAEQLTVQLGRLQERKRQRATGVVDSEAGAMDHDHWSSASATSASSTAAASHSISHSAQLWRRIAKRQLAELKSVEKENASLREEVDKLWKQMKSLEKSLATAKIDQLRQLNRHKQADELDALMRPG